MKDYLNSCSDTCLMAIFHDTPGKPVQNFSALDSIGDKDDGCDGNNWSYKICKDPVKMSPPVNRHSTVSENWKEKASCSMAFLTSGSSGSLPILSLTTKGSWLPWGRLPSLSSALWHQYWNSCSGNETIWNYTNNQTSTALTSLCINFLDIWPTSYYDFMKVTQKSIIFTHNKIYIKPLSYPTHYISMF